MRKETRPGSTALTNCTGIATRLKLIVPLHITCTAISSLLLEGDFDGVGIGSRVFNLGYFLKTCFKGLKQLIRCCWFQAPWSQDNNFFSAGFFLDQISKLFLMFVFEFLRLKMSGQLIDQFATYFQFFFRQRKFLKFK